MRIYLKNNPAKFHPDPTWNDEALGYVEDGNPNPNNNNKMSSDYGISSWSETLFHFRQPATNLGLFQFCLSFNVLLQLRGQHQREK